MIIDCNRIKENIMLFQMGFKNNFEIEYCNSVMLNVSMFVGDSSDLGFKEDVILKHVQEAFRYGIMLDNDVNSSQLSMYASLLFKALKEIQEYFNE